MKINVRAHNMSNTDALKTYAFKKMDKLETFFEHIQEIVVELDVRANAAENERHFATATVWASGTTLRAETAKGDMYASIDALLEKLEIQLKKHKQKLMERRRDAQKTSRDISSAADAPSNSIQAQATEPRYVKKPMAPEDAALICEKEHLQFLVFHNFDTGKVSVIYPIQGNEYGLIDTE